MGFNLIDSLIRLWRVRKIKKNIPKNCVLCDLGCGKSAYLLKKLSSKIKLGIGIDREIISFKENNLQFINSDLNNFLPLENESVDCITMLSVLEHLENSEEVIREAYRILKRGGVILITTPSEKAKNFLELLAFKLKITSAKEIKDHKHYFSKKEIEELLTRNGFSEIEIQTFELKFNYFIKALKK
ncbi:MAG: class I SAM-dependent methyltransferase [Patescibacteria group bacterium]|nr:class I SAM-dependent methyltransferase [Patescibacteria group bacterium]